MRLDAKTIQWATRRKISAETLKKLNAGGEIIQFGDRQLPAIVFHYLDAHGESVNYKARALNEKAFKQRANGQQQFFNQAAVMAGPMDEVYVVEGEMDACALVEAGVPVHSILSVVGGRTVNASSDDPA
jgi:twinkle protein